MYNTSRWTASSFFASYEKRFGVNRLHSGTAEEWDEWEAHYASTHPYLKAMYSTIDGVQNIVSWPCRVVHDALYYLHYRFIKKTHLVNTLLIPGQYYETDIRLISAMFSLLVDHVEIDKASMQRYCEANSYVSPNAWYQLFRSAGMGLRYLAWESTLTTENGSYAQNAQDKIDLYLWWTVDRVHRPDPYEVTGYNDYCAQVSQDGWNQDYDVVQPMLRQVREIQNDYDAEDTEKMIQLVRMRHTLTT